MLPNLFGGHRLRAMACAGWCHELFCEPPVLVFQHTAIFPSFVYTSPWCISNPIQPGDETVNGIGIHFILSRSPALSWNRFVRRTFPVVMTCVLPGPGLILVQIPVAMEISSPDGRREERGKTMNWQGSAPPSPAKELGRFVGIHYQYNAFSHGISPPLTPHPPPLSCHCQ